MSNISLRPEYGWSLIAVVAAAFISFFVSFQAGVFVLLFAAAAWWVWQHPEQGFLLLIVAAPILPMLKITQTISTITLIKDVIILTLFFRQFLLPCLKKNLPYRRNVLFAPVAALAIWTGLEMLRADSLILGVLRARDIVLYILLYFAILYLKHGRKEMRDRLIWFSLSVGALLLLGAYQWFFAVDSAVLRFDPFRSIWIPRLSSILAHPSIFGEYMVIAASLFVSIAALGRKRSVQIIAAAFAVVSLPFIFLTYSRAVWIGLATALIVMAAAYVIRLAHRRFSKRYVWKYAGITAIVAVLLVIAIFRLTPGGVFLRSAFDPTYGSNVERIEFLSRLIAPMTNSEALFGRGLGDVLKQNFREVDLETYDIATGGARAVQLTKNRTLVDNQYLKTFVEMGLAGVLIYAWIYWRFIKAALRKILGNKNQARYDIEIAHILGLWGIGFATAFIVQGFFIDIWDIFPTNAAFWVVAALVSAQEA